MDTRSETIKVMSAAQERQSRKAWREGESGQWSQKRSQSPSGDLRLIPSEGPAQTVL